MVLKLYETAKVVRFANVIPYKSTNYTQIGLWYNILCLYHHFIDHNDGSVKGYAA